LIKDLTQQKNATAYLFLSRKKTKKKFIADIQRYVDQ